MLIKVHFFELKFLEFALVSIEISSPWFFHKVPKSSVETPLSLTPNSSILIFFLFIKLL